MLRAAALPPPQPLARLLDDALAASPLPSLRAPARVTIIVSDATRDEPRREILRAICARLPSSVRLTLAIATGTHGPSTADFVAGLVEACGREVSVVDHDGHDDRDLTTLGTTARGTPVIVHRCVVDSDLVVATGCIRPHYFAGFGAGAKAIFPGLGQAAAIRINHAWKRLPGARAGCLEGNPCREDIDEAVAMLATPTFLLNGVPGPDHLIHAVVAGELHDAFRRGCAISRPWFTVRSRRAPVVIASDALPVTATLYQAAKLAAAAAPLVEPGGTLVVAAECADGTGPLDVVNEAIFRIGVLPRLATGVSLQLLSSLPDHVVAKTLLTPFDARTILDKTPIILMGNASALLAEVAS